MRRLIYALAALLLWTAPAIAQSTKAQLNTEVSTNFPDNTTGAITPQILRNTVNDIIASFQQAPRVNAQTGTSYAFSVADYGYLVTFSNGSPVAVTLSQATGTFATWNVLACNQGAGVVTITPTTSTINGASTFTLNTRQCTFIVSDGTNYQIFNNDNNINITGGTITGLPAPTLSSDAATKGYVDATATGLHILTPVRLATAAVLPNTPTYSNGASGVGATLTAGANSTLTVDGTVANLNDRVLVKNQATAANNGIYTLTTAGGGVPWVLTRATDFDTAAEMVAGSYTFVSAGSTNINTAYVLQTTVATVGSDAVTFILFSSSSTLSVAGSSGNVQTNNGSGNLGALTDTQLAGKITPLDSTWSGQQTYSGAALFGSGKPWIDVTSGTNGCTIPVVPSTGDWTTTIQCQLDYIKNTLTGGILFIPHTPGFCLKITGLLTVYAGTTVVGTGMGFGGSPFGFGSCITTATVDLPAFRLEGGSNSYPGLRDIAVFCGTSTSAMQSCVYVHDNTPANLTNVYIVGGYRALDTHGVDGRYYNVYATAAATTVGSANLFSQGANWYYGCKFDSTVATDFGIYIYAPYAPSSSNMENHFSDVDASGPFGSSGMAIDDSANPMGAVAITWCTNCIISANGGGTVNLIINQAVWTMISGSALRFITLGASGGTLTLGNSWGGASPGGAVTGAGTDRICSNNKNLSC